MLPSWWSAVPSKSHLCSCITRVLKDGFFQISFTLIILACHESLPKDAPRNTNFLVLVLSAVLASATWILRVNSRIWNWRKSRFTVLFNHSRPPLFYAKLSSYDLLPQKLVVLCERPLGWRLASNIVSKGKSLTYIWTWINPVYSEVDGKSWAYIWDIMGCPKRFDNFVIS